MKVLKFLTWMIAGALALVTLMAALLVLVINSVDWNRHLDFVASTTERFTDWQVDSLEGLRVHVGIKTSLHLTGLEAHQDPKDEGNVIAAKNASIALEPLRLFIDRLVIDNMNLSEGHALIGMREPDPRPSEANSSDSSPFDSWPLVFLRQASIDAFDIKVLRQVLKLRRMKPHDRSEQEELLDLYKAALGMV